MPILHITNHKTIKTKKSHNPIHKRTLKRIDWGVVKRIISLLHTEGGKKRTELAMKANLSYHKCILYIKWMETLELIIKKNDDRGYEKIILTERGIRLYKNEID